MANRGLVGSCEFSLPDRRECTRAFYLREATRFAAWLDANGRPKGAIGDLLAVTRQDAVAWLSALRAACNPHNPQPMGGHARLLRVGGERGPDG